jgi:putative membrane protein
LNYSTPGGYCDATIFQTGVRPGKMRRHVRILLSHPAAGLFWLPASAALAALLCGALIILPSNAFGSFSVHMTAHIAAMSIVAPLCAIAIVAATRRRISSEAFWVATALQIVALWAWHLPMAQHFSGHGLAGPLLMHGSLFLAALAFWTSLLRLHGRQRWHGVLGLLMTGKFSCLLAALFVFAPRLLYQSSHHLSHALDDQQLAGLLMITACPLSYVVAGIVITVQLINDFPARTDVRTT